VQHFLWKIKNKKIEPLYSLQWLSQFLSGLATCVGYAWLSGDQPRRFGRARLLLVVALILP
jgi:hypothetical protein